MTAIRERLDFSFPAWYLIIIKNSFSVLTAKENQP